MSQLSELFEVGGQSPWLDNLRRDWIYNGELEAWIGRGIRGITSNPTIFQKAMTSTDAYHSQLQELISQGLDLEASYWKLVVTDIADAAALLTPVYEQSRGVDGYVSVEVSPELANSTEATITAARHLRAQISAPNVMIKVPATPEGIPAISVLTAEGINVNVTLIFGLSRYVQVMEAYLSGLEACSGDLSEIHSVASFFISRVDTEVDQRLRDVGIGGQDLLGKAAVAQARLAYQLFQETFQGSRWEALEQHGANKQRPLWASTSTKNPNYPDTLYVDSLVGPNSVNTIPEATINAFLDHGTVSRTIDHDLADAKDTFDALATCNVSIEEVAHKLEREGVNSFKQSFNDVLAALEKVSRSFTSL